VYLVIVTVIVFSLGERLRKKKSFTQNRVFVTNDNKFETSNYNNFQNSDLLKAVTITAKEIAYKPTEQTFFCYTLV